MDIPQLRRVRRVYTSLHQWRMDPADRQQFGEARGDYTPDTALAQGLTHDPADQVTVNRLASTRAIAWIRDNPVKFLLLMPNKLVRLRAPDGEAEWFYQLGFVRYGSNTVSFRSIRVLNQAHYCMILLLALPSVWLSL